MKPEHFIYKSDDLYYMQNVPNKPGRFFTYYQANGKTAETGQYAWKIYNEALERAKAEAVLVTEPYIYQKAMHSYFPHHIDYSKTPQDNFTMYATQGQIYTINMEEKIEVVCEGRCKGINCTMGKVCDGDSSHNCLDKVARIAAPKKEDDPFKLVEMCNFPKDYAHENGNYINKCHSCGFYFKGHKRRVTCKMCSEFTLEEWKKIAAMKTPEDTKHAHAGCWLQGEMVGYARCMVKWLESAPKKEEESEEHLWDLVLSTYAGNFYHADTADEKAIISEIKEKFEIKRRKPL